MQSHMMLLRAEMIAKDAGMAARYTAPNAAASTSSLFPRWRSRSARADGQGAMQIVAARAALETETLTNKAR